MLNPRSLFVGSGCPLAKAEGGQEHPLATITGDCIPGAVDQLSQQMDISPDVSRRLNSGEVVVGLKEVGKVKYVVGKVLINEPPKVVWPILVNPYEFAGTISSRMKEVKVLLNKSNRSILKCTIGVGFFLPDITYIVDSLYVPLKRIEFHSIGGTLKSFDGEWQLISRDGGNKTEVAYTVNIDPGYPVPSWMVRAGVRMELPKTLDGLRQRLLDIRAMKVAPLKPVFIAGTMEAISRL